MKEGITPNKRDKHIRFMKVSKETTEALQDYADGDFNIDINTKGSRRKVVKSRDSKIASNIKMIRDNARGVAWDYMDSPLMGGSRSFQGLFQDVIPEHTNIKEYVEKNLGNYKNNVVLLELGGPANALSKGFSEKFLKKSAGVTLPDIDKTQRESIEGNLAKNHEIIEGNMFTEETRIKIEKWLNGDKVDLVFEKMEGALVNIPNHTAEWINQMKWVYKLSSYKAMIFLQIGYWSGNAEKPFHIVSKKIIEPWIKMIQKDFKGKLDVAWDGNVMRINKLSGAPEELPELEIIP